MEHKCLRFSIRLYTSLNTPIYYHPSRTQFVFLTKIYFDSAHSARRLNLALFSRAGFCRQKRSMGKREFGKESFLALS